ncbi:hypothetical protein [Nannocystis pusilla]|uniref:hypothetical protein n=1 Tax=Nannocystis pusilla TaxID=889268 RepID=UPI003BF1CFF1
MRRLPLAAAALLAACNHENQPAFSTGPGVTSVAASSTTSTTSGGSSSSAWSSSTTSTSGGAEDSAAASSSDEGPPDVPDFGDPQPEGCKGKIDFLFVISALGTMHHEQDQLLASFPGFMATISDKFADFDTHIISVNTDNEWRGVGCESPEFCLSINNCGPYALDYVCGSHADNVFKCDRTRGAGLLFNAGPYAANHVCELDGGHRYMIAPDPDDFECIARVGTFGDIPRMGDTLVAAVSDALNDPQGCNAGFLRPDALLVFVLITDTNDIKSISSVKQVHDTVVAAKGGDEDSIVGLAVVAQPLLGEPVPDCVYDELGNNYSLDVVETFPYHLDGDICADSYAPFFDQAADLVHEACSNFIPQ